MGGVGRKREGGWEVLEGRGGVVEGGGEKEELWVGRRGTLLGRRGWTESRMSGQGNITRPFVLFAPPEFLMSSISGEEKIKN